MPTEDARLSDFLPDDGGDARDDDDGSAERGSGGQPGTNPDDDQPGTTPDDDGQPGTNPDDGDQPGTTPDDDVAPAVPTATWRPAGAPCADCGAVVSRRWLADGELVCPDCVSW